jgi:RNA polymerase sigma-70 factor (sigma-E family)
VSGAARTRHLRVVPTAAPDVPAEELVALADEGLDESFSDFVQANTPALLRTAVAHTRSWTAAEELVQDTLVRLYPQWARVQSADVPLAYVRRAMSNQSVTTWRQTTRCEVLVETGSDRLTAPSAEHDIVERDEMWARLQTLSRRQRAAVVLRFYEGLADVEIAETLGCQVGTVRSLISRGLATLRVAA